MLHFRMDMPLYLMMLYGSILLLAVLLLRALLKNRLPKFVFPVLWGLVLLRLLVPYALSSPLSVKRVPALSLPDAFTEVENTAVYLPNENIREEITIQSEAPVQEQDAPPIETIAEDAVAVSGTDTNTASTHYGLPSYYMDNARFLSRRVVYGIYILGVIITIAILAYQKRGYAKKLKNSLLVEHNETVNAILREMNMGHILVFTNDEIASPLVCGLLAPRIYLPTRMDFGNTELLRHILMHETMHIRRRDNWIKSVMLLALCINWFNPLVWIMSKCLSSDLELACDEAVLTRCDAQQRQSYALSLLAMAITASRPTLLYSAFAKTEVEKRVNSIVRYKKASAFAFLLSLLLLAGSTVVFATGGQAPFSSYLSSYCSSSNCRWSAKAYITRDIQLGEDAAQRADDTILEVLRTDTDNDPALIEAKLKDALAAAFGVEQEAFRVDVSLFLTDEARDAEYEQWGITYDGKGLFLYQGEAIRFFYDEMDGHFQSTDTGTVDVSVQRDRLGYITDLTVLREGDAEYERRSMNRTYHSYTGTTYHYYYSEDDVAVTEAAITP
ncbi:MAG: M56 family metallopeptidase [Roseburia sp.]|nr:M56 family metallopeptidase [Roseburia sp.]